MSFIVIDTFALSGRQASLWNLVNRPVVAMNSTASPRMFAHAYNSPSMLIYARKLLKARDHYLLIAL